MRVDSTPLRPELASALKAWWWRWCIVALVSALWVYQVWYSYAGYGLFKGIAVDFGYYYAQVMALWSGEPARMYDLDALTRYHDALAIYTPDPTQSLEPSHVPYPPLFAWLFTPFTWPSPPLGYVLWTICNFGAALFLVYRAASLFPRRAQLWVGLLVITHFSVLQSLYVGQSTILLAIAVGEFYLALRARREFRAGLWLGALLLKPQYLALIALLLLWKRRWAAIAGAAITVGLIVLGSLLVTGLPALLAYPHSIFDVAALQGGNGIYPRGMITWRALILFLMPQLGTKASLLLMLGLGLLTVIGAAATWRGPWKPASRNFPAQMTLLLVATLIANYHGYPHGEALLALPVASLFAEGFVSRWSRVILWLAIFAPSIQLLSFFLVTQGVAVPSFTLRASPLVPFSLALCLIALLADLFSREQAMGRFLWSRVKVHANVAMS